MALMLASSLAFSCAARALADAASQLLPSFEVQTLYHGDHARGGYFFELMADRDDETVLFSTDYPKHIIRHLDLVKGTLEIYAGTHGKTGYKDGPREQALFSSPKGVCQDPWGSLYVADSGNALIRRIDGNTGMVTTVAGTAAAPGYVDGNASDAKFTREITQLVCRLDGSVLVGDTGSSTVRRIACVANCSGPDSPDSPHSPPSPPHSPSSPPPPAPPLAPGDTPEPPPRGGLPVWALVTLGALGGFAVGVVSVAALLIFGSKSVLQEVNRAADAAHGDDEGGPSTEPLLAGAAAGAAAERMESGRAPSAHAHRIASLVAGSLDSGELQFPADDAGSFESAVDRARADNNSALFSASSQLAGPPAGGNSAADLAQAGQGPRNKDAF